MRTRVLAALAIGLAVFGGTACSTPGEPQAPATSTVAAPALPFDLMPANPGGKEDQTPCPYLETQWVADTNGQRMTGYGIDTRFDPPACVFYSYPDDPQLVALVRHEATEADAREVVDWAAPIATTDPAEEPAGWSGGRGGFEDHSVYAVSKGTTAVVVFSNQGQSVKPQLVAEEIIRNLGL